MLKLFSTLLFLVISTFVYAQELNCEVKVTYENVQQTDPSVFRSMEEKITAFLNETKWTRDTFEPEERINCSFFINILSEVNQNRFAAQVTIKSTRPVYNSDYETVVLDIIDNDFEFEYDPFSVIEFRKNEFTDNLSASLAFYANIILGLDYDSFDEFGGYKYFTEASKIVAQAANSNYPGWTQSSTKNSGDVSKFWISENLNSTRYRSFRSEFYKYHRNVLDQLYDEPTQAWKSMDQVINRLHRFYKQNRNLPIMYLFFDAKSDEIVNVMSKATPAQKLNVSEKCQEMDPLNTKQYKKLSK